MMFVRPFLELTGKKFATVFQFRRMFPNAKNVDQQQDRGSNLKSKRLIFGIDMQNHCYGEGLVHAAACNTINDHISDFTNKTIDLSSHPLSATSFVCHTSPRDSRLPTSYATREIEKSTNLVDHRDADCFSLVSSFECCIDRT
jgi:hypothetical protein